ncbi:hypothetical protein BS78_06G002900 [Paspalum vaginatum]|nr:hypothetical protein BS78_06G002900 [Paspalum vaginatum]
MDRSVDNDVKESLDLILQELGNFAFGRDDNEEIKLDRSVVADVHLHSCVDDEGSIIVGRDSEKHRIVNTLLDRVKDNSRGFFTLAIVGLGGVGKTTLARMVFSDTAVSSRYYNRAWVNVGYEFDLKIIGNCILSQLSSSKGEEEHQGYYLSDVELIMKRLDELVGGGGANRKALLVVLDDVWTQSHSHFEELQRMLAGGAETTKEDSSTGSNKVVTVMITTRRPDTAGACAPRLTIPLERLSSWYSWQLLQRKLGSTTRLDATTGTLEEREQILGDDIANKCWGLPLAIHALGYTMRSKSSEEIKSVIINSYIWDEGEEPILQPLLLSYLCMPPNLRLCFAYCAVFPRNHNILKDDLIHHWIALQLIQPSDGRLSTTLLAHKYIEMLLGMSFLQPTMQPSGDKSVVSFTMHGLIHDLAVAVSSGRSIILDSRNSYQSFRQENCHRQAWLTNCDDVSPRHLSGILSAQLRTLIFHGCNMQLSDDSFSSTKDLRVLDLRECWLQKLPDSICQLSQLRYLNLSGSYRLAKLSDSFGNLTNAVHVNLSGCSGLLELPASFGNLTNVVHVNLSGCSGLLKLPASFANLTSVMHIDLSGCIGLNSLIESFGNLTNVVHINLSGCSGLLELPASFGNLTNVEHVNLSGCSGLLKLPASFSNLTSVMHIDLSGCIGLNSLIESFGNLTNVVHVNLSGCSGLLELPASFGNLTNVEHVNLSGCSGLIKLPASFANLTSVMHIDLSGCIGLNSLIESFGNLTNVVHVNLSGCVGLQNLPKSFGLLQNLEHLDLSSWSCFEGLRSVLCRLTNLQHLNLSYPCCYLAEHRSHLEALKDVWVKVTNLRYLNLSMCLNPVFCYFEEKGRTEYIESISFLHMLEYLDLSHNVFLFDIPESLGELSQLQTLNLSGCVRLKRIEKWMGEKKFPKKHLVVSNCLGLQTYQFVVHSDDGRAGSSSNLAELKDVSCREVEISCLEKVTSTEEARSVRLVEKKLQKLKLVWSAASDDVPDVLSLKDEALLAELVPPHSLQCFELQGYSSEYLPSWLTSSMCSHVPNLVEITMVDIPSCSSLPPFGVLPNLQRLVLRKVVKVTRIDTVHLSGHQLSYVTWDGMESLEEIVFPTTTALDELVVISCPNLRWSADCPPKARMLVISDCDQLMMSPASEKKGEHQDAMEEGPSTSTCCTTSASPVTEVLIQSFTVPLDESKWNLLDGFAPLHSLYIMDCSERIISTEIMQRRCMSSLQLLCFSHCDSMTCIPEHVVQDKYPRELVIHECSGIKTLPQRICEKNKGGYPLVRIRNCPELNKWCESEENKNKLAHMKLIFELFGNSEADSAKHIRHRPRHKRIQFQPAMP